MKEYVLDLGEMFDAYAAERNRSWGHDRSQTVGASEVFTCLRQVWFDKLGKEHGHEPDADYVDRWGATLRGSIIEDHFVVPAIAGHLPKGLEASHYGDDQVTFRIGRSSATPDCLITGFPEGCQVVVKYGETEVVIEDIKSDCLVLEVKSLNPMIELFDEKTVHKGQAITQMGHFKENTKYDPHYAIIIYINASWLDDIDPFVVEYDENVYANAKQRSQDVFEVTDPNEILPEGKMDGQCTYCRWRAACGTAIISSIPELDVGDVDTELREYMNEVVDEYKLAKEAEEKATYAKKKAQENLKELLTEAQVRKVKEEGSWSISWSKIAGRKTFDKKAAEADGMDLSPYMKEGNPYDVLRVNFSKGKGKDK
ncbi:MAG: hypothetical protein KJP02_00260 [Octadecabacter sp.]|nr:hypothetical protein [Octadecabacter sp.]